ncbi:MAG TPA: T9SS type A sorting domain-containing protein [Ignavibacteriaceae bacterium]|nr:T9SS type A sorting domain-containing protein [Ignavibacteriaceae bacterium]
MKKVLLLTFLLSFVSLLNAQWVNQTSGVITGLASISAVDDNVCWMAGDAGVVLRTTNGGTTWTNVGGGIIGANDCYNIYAIDANTALVTWSPAATYVAKTTNGGATWTQVWTQAGGFMDAINFFNATEGIMVGDPVGNRWTIFKTNDAGSTWDSTGLYLPLGTSGEAGWNNSLFISGNDVYFGTNKNKVYHSTNRGLTFTAQPISAFANSFGIHFTSPTRGMVAASTGIVNTTNGGTNWNTSTGIIGSGTIYSIIGASNVWYYERGLSIYGTTNDGALWTSVYTTAGGTQILDLKQARNGTTAWASTDGGTIVKGTNISLPVELTSFTASANENNVVLNWVTKTEINNKGFEVERKDAQGNSVTVGYINGNGTTTEEHSYSFIDSKVSDGKYSYRIKQLDYDGKFNYSEYIEVTVITPAQFALLQNYPNPFNPSTKIVFNVPQAGNVKLAVFNLLGQEVSTLVNEFRAAGTYEINFDASNLTSGSYFYKIEAGQYSSIKKMMLTK